MEKELREEYKEITVYAKDKEQALSLVAELFPEEESKQVKEKVSFWTKLGSFFRLLVVVLFKLLLFLILTPFFLFTWLKNMFFLSIGFSICYPIISFAYYSFFSNLVTTDEMMVATFTETKFKILAVVVIVMGFLSAMYDYQEKFEDIMLI
ncbi:hypothetical protein K5Q29_02800 [Streptococcus sp. 2018037]|uniref:hypothetical protein n=1 Tax=Streptococcus sp. 2018037 TaxID=2870782 RepID=UPI001C8D5B94|nr:hypothetical protein [Streptococcus sp. 2018037]MBY0752380.1 hypothetical protein [Streptococcus sp. 2018037]